MLFRVQFFNIVYFNLTLLGESSAQSLQNRYASPLSGDAYIVIDTRLLTPNFYASPSSGDAYSD